MRQFLYFVSNIVLVVLVGLGLALLGACAGAQPYPPLPKMSPAEASLSKIADLCRQGPESSVEWTENGTKYAIRCHRTRDI